MTANPAAAPVASPVQPIIQQPQPVQPTRPAVINSPVQPVSAAIRPPPPPPVVAQPEVPQGK